MLPVSRPTPLVQIALGGLIGLVADARVALDPELFRRPSPPSPLFLDGWRFPRDALPKDAATVVELALGSC